MKNLRSFLIIVTIFSSLSLFGEFSWDNIPDIQMNDPKTTQREVQETAKKVINLLKTDTVHSSNSFLQNILEGSFRKINRIKDINNLIHINLEQFAGQEAMKGVVKVSCSYLCISILNYIANDNHDSKYLETVKKLLSLGINPNKALMIDHIIGLVLKQPMDLSLVFFYVMNKIYPEIFKLMIPHGLSLEILANSMEKSLPKFDSFIDIPNSLSVDDSFEQRFTFDDQPSNNINQTFANNRSCSCNAQKDTRKFEKGRKRNRRSRNR